MWCFVQQNRKIGVLCKIVGGLCNFLQRNTASEVNLKDKRGVTPIIIMVASFFSLSAHRKPRRLVPCPHQLYLLSPGSHAPPIIPCRLRFVIHRPSSFWRMIPWAWRTSVWDNTFEATEKMQRHKDFARLFVFNPLVTRCTFRSYKTW